MQNVIFIVGTIVKFICEIYISVNSIVDLERYWLTNVTYNIFMMKYDTEGLGIRDRHLIYSL
jgi:hypothetical protein